MRLKRIKKLRINSLMFTVVWDKTYHGGSFNYRTKELRLGTKYDSEEGLLEALCHELLEIVALEMHIRFNRHDCTTDFIFVYDHRQHDTMANMFSGLLAQFIN